ncbi:30S ribosomal protein S1 [Anaerophaga thermohalophila]|jgi:small subunit ribosomal protein S1|uniref:30S ribosomal protein S1 n=1 Tax=Anaerophaga thermohalophila TaxID=177400 RepID=UPI0003045C11|nr:30S ribosomal protein S1 [Anaerophaga thermohalophila]
MAEFEEKENLQEQENASEVNENVEEQTPQAEEANEESPEATETRKEDQEVETVETANADFDWDKYENGDLVEEAKGSEKKELEKMYDKTLSTISEKEVIEGTVIAMNKREVVINIGFKSDGIVSRNEFRYNPDLKVGDKVEVYVESQEDKKGQLVLSHKKARALRSWDRVNEALEKDEVIKGYIKCRTKGGMIVDVFGIEAFLPGSQIDVKPIRDYDMYVGKTMEFKVVKINPEFKNVVVSHKALIEAELEQQKKEIISKLEKGQVLEGTVKNITSYGVFIDLGGVDGLIHITDLSWGRVSHPEEIVQLDQKLNVVILDFDDEKKRIALGLKQLTPHPWDSLDPNLKVGDVVKGKVVVMADYGAFVEIAPGVEGLIHVSEMSWSQHLRSAQDFLKVGDEIEAQILTLDREERKMSLGMKQLKPDPWDNIEEKYPVGSKHKAKVRNFTNFGVFVEIEEGIDGLIHISDLSWTKKVKHPAEFTNVGEEIEVVVLDIDKDNRRLSLGHKQLEENPWDVFETIFTVDSIHEGTIVDIFDKGAVIALPYGVEGFATPRHLVKEDGSQAKADEKLPFKVIEFNKGAKRIILSHSRVFEDEKRSEEQSAKKSQAKNTKKGVKKLKDSLEKTTLGDISELAALKNQMEASEKKDETKDKKEEE